MSKPFKMKSGNSPLFKNMGSSPAKGAESELHTHNDHHDLSTLGSGKFPTRGKGPAKTGSPAKQGMVNPEVQMAQAGVPPQTMVQPPTYKKGSPAKQSYHDAGGGGGGGEQSRPGEITKYAKKEFKKLYTKRPLSEMPFYSPERIAEYKRRGWAMDETTHKGQKPETSVAVGPKESVESKKGKKTLAPPAHEVTHAPKKTGSPAKQTEGKSTVESIEMMQGFHGMMKEYQAELNKAKDQDKPKNVLQRIKDKIAKIKAKIAAKKSKVPGIGKKTGSPAKIYNKPKGKRTEY